MSVSFVVGVSFLLDVLPGLITRHDTPPFQTPSPISRHSSFQRPRPCPCCSGRCSHPARSRCERSMAGNPSITSWNSPSLTKRPEPRHTESDPEVPNGNFHKLRDTTMACSEEDTQSRRRNEQQSVSVLAPAYKMLMRADN